MKPKDNSRTEDEDEGLTDDLHSISAPNHRKHVIEIGRALVVEDKEALDILA